MPGFGDGFAGSFGPILMAKMLQQPGEDTKTTGLRTLGVLNGSGGNTQSPLMRRLLEMASLIKADKQPGPKNNWGLNSLTNAFSAVPVQGGTGFGDWLGGLFGTAQPGMGGGDPNGMSAPGPEGDMYSTGAMDAGLGADAGMFL